MLLMLAQWLGQDIRGFNVFNYITLRAVLAAMTALVISFLAGPRLIRWLAAKKIGQAVRNDGPQTHLVKSGTPTMGGALILIAIAITTLLWGDLANRYVWVLLIVTLGFGAIGWYDDWKKVVYHDPLRRSDEDALKVSYLPFDELLASADFVLAMAPLTPENRGMFGAEQFARMRPCTYFINSARGPLVDMDALCDALRQRKIANAALDVVDPEPLPASHPLLQLPNVLVTPHIGTATDETRDAMACLAAENLLAGLQRKPLPSCVNRDVNYR